MWLFVAVSLAIATPCFRAWLEALFAELSIIFFNYLRLVSFGLSVVFVLALVFHGRRFLRSRRVAAKQRSGEEAAATEDKTSSKGFLHVQWRRGAPSGPRQPLLLRVKATTSEIAGSGFYPPQLWTTVLFALTMLPIINSVMVGGGNLRALKSEATAAAETAAYVAAYDADAAALVALNKQLTTCKYSGGDDCLNDVTQTSLLGEYQQGSGHCVAFDAAYVNVTAGAGLPTQYFPITVEEANAQGFTNNFSAWSEANQEKFQTDCPLLYEETVVGEGEELLCCTERQYEALSLQLKGLSRLDNWLTTQMKRWGDFVAMGNHPLYIILLALMIIICSSSGLVRLKLETDPIKLWASDTSNILEEKIHFGEILGPLDRVEHLVLVAKDGGAVTRPAYIKEAIRLQEIIAKDITSGIIALSDICVKDASSSPCQVNAVTQYFQNSMDHFKVYETYNLETEHLRNCANTPARNDVKVCADLQSLVNASGDSLPIAMSECPCVSSFGTPMTEINKYFGGFAADSDSVDINTYLEQATALYSTALVANHQDTAKNADAIAWEREFIIRMQLEAEMNVLFDIYYSAETSSNDEFANSSRMETIFKAAAAGFIFVALYVIIGLNHWKVGHRFFQTSKIGVGLSGVACILMAITATLGVFAWTGLKLQIVTIVVMPLVVLAIGSGNVFLILNAVALKQEELKMEQRSLFTGLEDNDFGIHEITCVLMCEAAGHIGPSMSLTIGCECFVVALATYSAMPAAQWLAVCLVVGIAASFTLQMTMFLAIVALDKRRELSGTYDIICCKRKSFTRCSRRSEDENTGTTENSSFPGSSYAAPDMNLMDRCVAGYVQLLLRKVSKVIVLFMFAGCTLATIVSIESMDRGLLSTSFIPSDSYLHDYFNAIDEHDLSTKEFPVYFVVDADYGNNPDAFNSLASDEETQRKLCTSKEFCNDLSIPNILSALVAADESNVTHFKKNAVIGSWLDDFWSFVDPDSECCRVDPKNGYAYSPLRPEENNAEYILARAKGAPSCLSDSSDALSIPQQSFMSLFSMFATAPAGPLCMYAAGTRFHRQLSIDSQPVPAMTSSETLEVALNATGYGNYVTAFAYKVVGSAATSLKASGSQEEAISAYSQARRIAEWISDETGIDVWVYSPNYIFLEQFRSVRRVAYIVLCVGLAMIFLIQSIALGSFWYGFTVALIAAITVVQVAGLMRPMGVPLNSLSVVCLAVASTFSVGFSGHFARLFAKARTTVDDSGDTPTGDACVKSALTQLLASWTLGVAVSKFVALAALALAATPVFEPTGNCFFRILMCAAACAWVNGAALLPVVLSISVDATEARVREVKATNEEGGEYSRESPLASYHGPPLSTKF
ncbi:NPC intracellular cholesterol transporter 1 [Phytophthora boehmeriae]|uniref:NPC intracellular cholesterol transporter 1 n=1 Tax=Phytophthora boehmeriae TaxID=109152 RepID=A0A8T1WVZ6_9STRA|nr:NPC intracellular cholesterol transporter 1 [Phytophthora boehmeriae]